MKEDNIMEIRELNKKESRERIEASNDYTDVMSDFLEK